MSVQHKTVTIGLPHIIGGLAAGIGLMGAGALYSHSRANQKDIDQTVNGLKRHYNKQFGDADWNRDIQYHLAVLKPDSGRVPSRASLRRAQDYLQFVKETELNSGLTEKRAGVVDGMIQEQVDRNDQRRSTYLRAVPFADALTARTDVGERTKMALLVQVLQAYQSKQGKTIKSPEVQEDKRMIGREVKEQNMGKEGALILSDEVMPEVYPVTVSNSKTVLNAAQALVKVALSPELAAAAENKAVQVASKAEQALKHHLSIHNTEPILNKYRDIMSKHFRQAARFSVYGKKANAPDPFGLMTADITPQQESTPISVVPKTDPKKGQTRLTESTDTFVRSAITRALTGGALGGAAVAKMHQMKFPGGTAPIPWKNIGVGALAGGAVLALDRIIEGKRKMVEEPKIAELVHKGKDGLSAKAGTTEKDVDPKELKMGIKVEREHSSDPKVQKEIALDHLTEFPKYYTYLKRMEESMSKKAFSPGFTDGTAPTSSLEAMNSMAATASTPFESPATLAAPKELRNKNPLRNPAKMAMDVLKKMGK